MMDIRKTILAAVLALCCLLPAGAQELNFRTRGKLIKENAELRSRVDSLIRELETYRTEKHMTDSLAAEIVYR